MGKHISSFVIEAKQLEEVLRMARMARLQQTENKSYRVLSENSMNLTGQEWQVGFCMLAHRL